jgi:DNA-binding beta-propeller fold protein YncE
MPPLLAAALLFSCSRTVEKETGGLSWPSAPEKARIRFAGAIFAKKAASSDRGIWSRLGRIVTGKKAEVLRSPYGLAKDAAGDLYVVDTGLRKVVIFSPKGRKKAEITADHELLSPIGIAIAGDKLFVTDSVRGVVFVIDKRGKVLGTFGGGLFERPTGIAASPDGGHLYVVDTKGHCIYRTTLSGEVEKKIGTRGTGEGQFNFPTNVTCTADGRLVVTDSMNFRVQVLTADGSFISEFGYAGDGPGTFSKPRGVAVDSEGHIYVVDALFDNVQVFSPEGEMLLAFGSSGYGPGRFYLPSGIYIDDEDRIYVADAYNQAVQFFDYVAGEDTHEERR